MSRFPSSQPRTLDYSYAAPGAVASFMNSVYAWMCVGLALTAIVAWWTATNLDVMRALGGGGYLVLLIAVIALPWVISGAIHKISSMVATLLFLLYSSIMGVFLSFVFIRYTGGSIAATFGVTAGTFAAMSVVGFVTKKDLTNLGGFLIMALLGLIIASIVNIFMQSPALYWLITYAGVLIFVGLTAYDTQKLKEIGATLGDGELAARYAIVGALMLYLDFINLFLYLLRLLGKARE